MLPRRRSLSSLSLHLKSIGGATEKREGEGGEGGREEKEKEREGEGVKEEGNETCNKINIRDGVLSFSLLLLFTKIKLIRKPNFIITLAIKLRSISDNRTSTCENYDVSYYVRLRKKAAGICTVYE